MKGRFELGHLGSLFLPQTPLRFWAAMAGVSPPEINLLTARGNYRCPPSFSPDRRRSFFGGFAVTLAGDPAVTFIGFPGPPSCGLTPVSDSRILAERFCPGGLTVREGRG